MYIENNDTLTIVYTAGLFDGEGSIVIGCGKKANRSPNYWLQVGITNTDKLLIYWLQVTFGGHISDNSHAPSRRAQRPCWAWRVMGNEAVAFLQELLPYLRIKKSQAVIAIQFQEQMVNYPLQSHKAKAQEHLATREAYRASSRALTLGQHSLS